MLKQMATCILVVTFFYCRDYTGLWASAAVDIAQLFLYKR